MSNDHTAAMRRVEAYRDKIARYATEGESLHDLGRLMVRLAEAEGEAKAWALRERVLSNTDDPARVKDALVTYLVSSPNDTSSGRGNDIARAEADGFRRAAGDLIGDM